MTLGLARGGREEEELLTHINQWNFGMNLLTKKIAERSDNTSIGNSSREKQRHRDRRLSVRN